jgi:hypothetical protein
MKPAQQHPVFVILEASDGRCGTLPLRGRGAVLVPRGTWHYAKVHDPCEMWFVTYGAGTRHRAV